MPSLQFRHNSPSIVQAFFCLCCCASAQCASMTPACWPCGSQQGVCFTPRRRLSDSDWWNFRPLAAQQRQRFWLAATAGPAPAARGPFHAARSMRVDSSGGRCPRPRHQPCSACQLKRSPVSAELAHPFGRSALPGDHAMSGQGPEQ